MPELPEVETTRAGISAHILDHKIIRVIVRENRLRWPIPDCLDKVLLKKRFQRIERRGKYLLLYAEMAESDAGNGVVIIHLGMSGCLKIVDVNAAAVKHDHVDIIFANNRCLRLHDPRRFGALLWEPNDPMQHDLLKHLGPEPLDAEFDGTVLYKGSRGRRVAIKQFIMNSRIVVGVGNIYANEALFMAGIDPLRCAGRISKARYQQLALAIKQVLNAAIQSGGTTLRDFYASDGQPGYFSQQLKVYGRDGQPCVTCSKPISLVKQHQRATYYCRRCQT